MKRINGCLAFGLFLVSAHGQQYAIDWFSVAGGGGTSSGGIYTVSGTIGQAAAGRLTSVRYVIEGGFWGVVSALQTPGAPPLHVQQLGNSVRVSWDASAAGYLLEETPALNSPAAPS